MKDKRIPLIYHHQWLRPPVANQETLILLHGFTGSSETFAKSSAYLPGINLLAVDLIGHGQTASPADLGYYDLAVVCQTLSDLVQNLALEHVHVLGYSMGARVALAWAIAEPELVRTVLLESGSPGLKTATAQEDRRLADQQLATKIMTKGLPDFVSYWEGLPLFASQASLSADQKEALRQERLSQSPLGLSNSLLGMGTGQQPSYWNALDTMVQPVYCLTGSLDLKFCRIGQAMTEAGTNVKQVILPGLGHCLHLEDPAAFYPVVADILRKEGVYEHC